MRDVTIVIKGAGEMASGIAHRLFKADWTRVCMLDIENPLCVRRTVSFCEALFEQQVEIEGVAGTRVHDLAGLYAAWDRNQIGIMVDPAWNIIDELKPDVVIDAILAKKNLGTHKEEAPIVIGVGPGFSAPDNVHPPLESNRGPRLGKAIYDGAPEPYTGVPASRGGFAWERVLRAPHAGKVLHAKSIGDPVQAGDVIFYVDATPVRTSIDGVVRGLIREIEVVENEKVGDIEPGDDIPGCWNISDKAKAIGEGVLQAIRTLWDIRENKIATFTRSQAMNVKCPVCKKQNNSSMKIARHIFGTGDRPHKVWVNSHGVSFTDLLLQQALENGNQGFTTLAQLVESAQETA
jgi:xanthine dehydrogenase accessory factor